MNNNLDITLSKLAIADHFDEVADQYHDHAEVQKQVARRLIAALDPWKDTLPAGPILELGCGTGFLTRGLLRLFKDRELIISDASEAMIGVCKNNITAADNVNFQRLDARQVPVKEPGYAFTISSFLAQWFPNPAYTLGQWLEVTKPGGLLLAAFPGSESFPEWKSHAQSLGIPFTGNALPDTDEMVVKLSSSRTQVDYYEDTVTQSFGCAVDFFRHLKMIGADKQLEGRALSHREMKLLLSHWDNSANGEIQVSYHVVFLAVKKNFTS